MGAVRSLRFSSDGRFLAMAEPADFVHVFDVDEGFQRYAACPFQLHAADLLVPNILTEEEGCPMHVYLCDCQQIGSCCESMWLVMCSTASNHSLGIEHS